MKILLIDPPGKNKGLNTGLGYLSAVLKNKHNVKVLDLNNIRLGLCGAPNPNVPKEELIEKIYGAIEDFKPELLGISVKTFTVAVSILILNIIKERNPNLLTVVGGPHISLDGLNFIEENRVDFGVMGEGEYTTLDLCDALEDNNGVENIEGISSWQSGQLVQHPRRKTVKSLDVLPYPYYENFSSVLANGGNLEEYPLLTSRGCPYRCSYCSMPRLMGGAWRSHSPARVIEELQHAKKKYHSTSFTVIDDNFTLNLKRVEEICDLLISERINLKWSSQNGIRADRISENLANKMKQSGCKYVWIGIESADEKVFNSINKGEELRQIERGIKHLKNAGIRVGGFFIVGLPLSTRESDLRSIDFVKKHKIDGWWFNFIPYPHTDAWEWVQIHGRIIRPLDGALQYGTEDIVPVFETEEYPKEVRMQTYDEIHVKGKYFDRLMDPALKQIIKWKLAFRKVVPYGPIAVYSLIVFVFKYNIKLVFNKLLR